MKPGYENHQENYSIEMCYESGEKFYTGKVVGDTLYKNFKLNTAVLWSKRQFGINVEIFDHLLTTGVKYIVYIDTATKTDAYRISVEKFNELKEMKELKYGRQYFVAMTEAEKLESVPQIPFVKRTIQIYEQ